MKIIWRPPKAWEPSWIAAIQKRDLRAFEAAGATGPATAKALNSIGRRRSRAFQKLVRRGIFIETSPGMFYMNSSRADAFRRQRRTDALVDFAVAALVTLAIASVVVLVAVTTFSFVHTG